MAVWQAQSANNFHRVLIKYHHLISLGRAIGGSYDKEILCLERKVVNMPIVETLALTNNFITVDVTFDSSADVLVDF